MKYCFSGHESFQCKSIWLKKGYDFINEGYKFTDNDAVVKLGVGKNMVASIRFWLKSFRLTINDELTNIAHYLFDSEKGKDPFTEDIGTLWLLHFILITENVASIYKLVFLDFQREKKEYDRQQLQFFIKRKCNILEQKNVYNENTVKKDIRVLFQSYIHPSTINSFEDFTGLFLPLNLIREVRHDVYAFNEIKEEKINKLLIFFMLRYMNCNDKTISFDRIQDMALILCIPLPDFLLLLRDLANEYPMDLVYSDNSGIRNVQFLKDIDMFDILDKYYK